MNSELDLAPRTLDAAPGSRSVSLGGIIKDAII